MMVGSVKATSGKIAKGPAARGVKRSGTDISEDTPLGDSRMKDDCIDDDSVSDAHSASLKKIKKHQALGISCDQSRLREIAEKQGFGYKTANLQELQRVCAAFNPKSIGSIQIAVPAFLGIPSNKIQEKLLMVGFDCSAQWSGVVETITDKQKVFEDKQFPATFLAARSDFNQALNDAWKKFVLLPDQGLDDFFVGVVGLDALLADVASRGNRLMVRSTGKEDTRELANAGGNTSVSNVEPTPAAVLAAIREVVESYFGMKSLTQRLGLGDASLFSAEAFTPVLIQEMVGEKSSDKKPLRCGVMFTEEPEGAIKSAGDEPVAHIQKTTGITLIQAAYGHNEGVVNSLIPVDTYYIMPGENPAIYPVIRAKKSRLVPAANGSSALTTVKNEKSLVLTRALSDQQLHTLKMFADCLESYYGYPMDVEFVIKDNTIFIVQARPVVHKEGLPAPSYLREGMPGIVFNGSTISAAGGSVRMINTADEMLVAPTIGVALNTYLTPAFKREKIKAVLVGAMAPSTSHEATTFRNEGIPVLYIPAWDQLVENLYKANQLLVSPQQNMILATRETVAGDILSGWNSYPIPQALSVLPALLGSLKTASGRMPLADIKTIPAKKNPKKWSSLLSAMKTGVHEDVIAATAQFFAQFKQAIEKNNPHKTLQADIVALLNGAKVLCQHIVANVGYAVGDPQYLRRLMPIKMLETLVYQQIDAVQVFKPLSLAMMGKILKDEATINAGGRIVSSHPGRKDAVASAKKVVDPLPHHMPATFESTQLHDYYVQLRKLDNNIFVEAVRDDWDWLLAQAASNKNWMGGIVTLVNKLQDVLLLPTWLHGDFAITMRDEVAQNPANIMAALMKWHAAYDVDEGFLAVLLEKYNIIRGINSSIFADATRCHAAWRLFNKQLLDYFAGPDFATAFQAAGAYGHQAAIKVLRELITLFDEAIKGVKGNAAMPDGDKLSLFQAMLKENFKLLQNVASLVPEGRRPKRFEIAEDPLRALATRREKYFSLMTKIINKDAFTAEDLLPTPGLSVIIFAMGSGHDWVGDIEPKQEPTSGEDIFSVMHQSLLNCCGILTVTKGQKIIKPDSVNAIEDSFLHATSEVNDFAGKPLVARLVGIDVFATKMAIYYNIPLNCHSCQVAFEYVQRTKKIELKAFFCGGTLDERYRWCNVANLCLLVGGDKTSGIKAQLDCLSSFLTINTLTIEHMDLFGFFWQSLMNLSFANDIDYSRYKALDASTYKKIIKKILSFNDDNIGVEGAILFGLNCLLREDMYSLLDAEIRNLVMRGLQIGGERIMTSAILLLGKCRSNKADLVAMAREYTQALVRDKTYKDPFNFFTALVTIGQYFDEAASYVRAKESDGLRYMEPFPTNLQKLKTLIAKKRAEFGIIQSTTESDLLDVGGPS